MFGNTERSLKDRDRSAQSRPGGADETTLGGHQWQRAHVPDRLRPDSRQLGERWPSRLAENDFARRPPCATPGLRNSALQTGFLTGDKTETG